MLTRASSLKDCEVAARGNVDVGHAGLLLDSDISSVIMAENGGGGNVVVLDIVARYQKQNSMHPPRWFCGAVMSSSRLRICDTTDGSGTATEFRIDVCCDWTTARSGVISFDSILG